MNPTNQKNPHTATYDTPLPLVLAGARGHGRWHLENIRRLQDKGIVRLAGICELTRWAPTRSRTASAHPSSPPTSGPSSTPRAPRSP